MYREIMLTVDGSPLAEEAVPYAVEMANQFGATLHLVRVIPPFTILMPTALDYDLSEDYRRQASQEAHQYLNDLSSRLREKLATPPRTQVIEGVVVDSLMDYARFYNIDLIVMATHGRSGISRWVFGSIAERVLHAAIPPVLLIRVRGKTVEAAEETEAQQLRQVQSELEEKAVNI